MDWPSAPTAPTVRRRVAAVVSDEWRVVPGRQSVALASAAAMSETRRIISGSRDLIAR
jgi:hypothetical protein